MSAPNDGAPIGDREVDRLLALVPPPPLPSAGLADRIAAQAAMTPQVPPLPPRRTPRPGRRRIGRRAWAGAVLGSFLVTIAAAAAVLGGHVDLHRLAAIPAALFSRHAAHAPARSAAAKPHAPTPHGVPTSPLPGVATEPRMVAVPPEPAGAMMPAPHDGDRAMRALVGRPAPPRLAERRPAELGHRAVRATIVREPSQHGGERREQRRAEDLSRRSLDGRASSKMSLPSAPIAREDDAASANRESLRASQAAAAPRGNAAIEQAGTGAAGYDGRRWNGQRWNGQRGPGWRRRGMGRFGGLRGDGAEASRPAAPAETGNAAKPNKERADPKGAGARGKRGGGGRRGKLRGGRR